LNSRTASALLLWLSLIKPIPPLDPSEGTSNIATENSNKQPVNKFITNRKFTSCFNIKILNRLWGEGEIYYFHCSLHDLDLYLYYTGS
jgi:hypothetical protein